MAIFSIRATYEYGADIEAETAEEAESIFLDDLNTYYMGTDSFDIEEIEEDEEDEEED